MPVFCVFFAEELRVLENARYERQEKLNIKRFSESLFPPADSWQSGAELLIDECSHAVVGENLLCRFLQLQRRYLLYATV